MFLLFLLTSLGIANDACRLDAEHQERATKVADLLSWNPGDSFPVIVDGAIPWVSFAVVGRGYSRLLIVSQTVDVSDCEASRDVCTPEVTTVTQVIAGVDVLGNITPKPWDCEGLRAEIQRALDLAPGGPPPLSR